MSDAAPPAPMSSRAPSIIHRPVAAAVKRAAEDSPSARAVLIAVGRRVNGVSIQVTRRLEGKKELSRITQIPEEKALSQGADLLSESVIYMIGGITVSYDWMRSRREKEAKKQKDVEAELKRRQEAAANEQRQWDEFRHLQMRITLMQQEILDLRKEQQQRSRWWPWSSGHTVDGGRGQESG